MRLMTLLQYFASNRLHHRFTLNLLKITHYPQVKAAHYGTPDVELAIIIFTAQ